MILSSYTSAKYFSLLLSENTADLGYQLVKYLSSMMEFSIFDLYSKAIFKALSKIPSAIRVLKEAWR